MRRALSVSQADVSPTLETLQTTIIMLQFLPGHENSTQRTFLGGTVRMAHALGLHQADSKRDVKMRMENYFDPVEFELKRRIWWHIVCTDWSVLVHILPISSIVDRNRQLSYLAGPSIGTYLVHPNQLNVLYPANADDDDITPDGVHVRDFDRDPTEMTFSLCKIWLANVLRELVDTACKDDLEVNELNYDQVMEFDRKLLQCGQMLPFFMQNDEMSRISSQQIDQERPYIAWQRNICDWALHTRISRLHRPFLFRGYTDFRYEYSRITCLRSDRAVFELANIMQEARGGFPDSSRLWIIVHHFVMATVALILDYCYTRNQPGSSEKREEILKAFKKLEMTQETSPVARAAWNNSERS